MTKQEIIEIVNNKLEYDYDNDIPYITNSVDTLLAKIKQEKKDAIQDFIRKAHQSMLDYYEIAIEDDEYWDEHDKNIIKAAFATAYKSMTFVAEKEREK